MTSPSFGHIHCAVLRQLTAIFTHQEWAKKTPVELTTGVNLYQRKTFR
jgi:hypothetical protein